MQYIKTCISGNAASTPSTPLQYFKSIANKDIVQIRISAKDKLRQDWDASINHGKKLLEKQVVMLLEKKNNAELTF